MGPLVPPPMRPLMIGQSLAMRWMAASPDARMYSASAACSFRFWYNGVGIQGGRSTPVNRAELQRFAKERISDAMVLLAARHWSAAYYLAGYAVECALKACIAKLMKSEEFPDRNFAEKCWTHNLPQLLGLAGL